MYVAPHPLEVLGHIAQQYAGMRESDRIERQAQENIGKQGEGRSAFMDALIRMLRQRQVGGGPQTPQGDYGTPQGGDL